MAQPRLLVAMAAMVLALSGKTSQAGQTAAVRLAGPTSSGAGPTDDPSPDSFFDRMTGQGGDRTIPVAQKVDHAAIQTGPPATPPGLAACVSPMTSFAELPRATGETIRYVIEVNGLSVGTIDFRIERHGEVNGTVVTEYRSLFKIADVVAALLPVEGRAAALVADATFWPIQAMNRYKIRRDEFDETQSFTDGGRSAHSVRLKNGKSADDSRVFPGSAQDFVTGFYLMRSLPPEAQGCVILYANQRAYTAWIKRDGDEQLMTPVGLKPSRRYAIKFASDKAKVPAEAKLWMSTGPDRLPYKAELLTGTHLLGYIHLYESGQDSPSPKSGQ